MAIDRQVRTKVICDICGKHILFWNSKGNGVSRSWAAYFARVEGCTTGKQIICKECRIRRKIRDCALIKKKGAPGESGEKCLGFTNVADEPIEKCKRCIANVEFDWEKERKRAEL